MNQFIQHLKNAYVEWQTIGFCNEAQNLNQLIGEEYFCVTNPHFFTGKLDAEIVLVHLNPKRNKDKNTNSFTKTKPEENGFKTFADYLNYYQNFGNINYGKSAPRKHKSPFDYKQIRFLRPLNILPFSSTDVYHNLETVIDSKLQIELVPFGSEDFNYRKVGVNNITPFINRILALIESFNRKYIIFCGVVFETILKPYTIQETKHVFNLEKKNGNQTQSSFELINLKLQFNNKIIQCAIAPQFAKQGYPIEEYGKKIKQLYGVY